MKRKRSRPQTVPTPVATPKPAERWVPYCQRSPRMTRARCRQLIRSFQGGTPMKALAFAWGISLEKVEAIIRREVTCFTWPDRKP